MKMLSIDGYNEIRNWMYRNARPIELARWQYHFEGGSKECVLNALSYYQNDDGGYGHGLESDNWNPNSSPYTTGVAIEIFRELGLYDPHHPIVKKAFKFLDSGVFFTERGWTFTIPSNSDYPRAPWWTFSVENNEHNGYHATGGIVGYILRCGDRKSRLYQKSLTIAQGMIEKLHNDRKIEMHQVGAYCALFEDIHKAGLMEELDYDFLEICLRQAVNETIERDPSKWPSYSMRPTMFIHSVDSPFFEENRADLDKEMDYLLSSRVPNGVWDITWKWQDYPKEFAISERWWQGFWAIRNVLTLKSFGRFTNQ